MFPTLNDTDDNIISKNYRMYNESSDYRTLDRTIFTDRK